MRFDLKVPFAEKDEAKKLGARWDPARKLWYIQDKEDLSPYGRWSPTPHNDNAPAPATSSARSPKPGAASGGYRGGPAPVGKPRVNQTEGLLIVGAQYRPQAQVCDCPPWESCNRCRG